MKKKKGFTLIELLAVIVILAIIALIATPIVMNMIEGAKKGAAERSAENYLKAVDTAIMEERMDGTIVDGEYEVDEDGNLCPIDGGCTEETKIVVEVSGTVPSTGTVIVIVQGEISKTQVIVVVGNYDVKYNDNEELVATEKTEGEGDSGNTTPEPTVLTDVCTYTGSSEADKYTLGATYTCELGDGATRTFYVLEDGDTTTLTEGRIAQIGQISLLMDQNFDTETMSWCIPDGKGTLQKNTCNADGTVAKLDEIRNSWATLNVDEISLPTGWQIAAAGGDSEWTDSTFTNTKLTGWLYGKNNYWTSTIRSDSSYTVWRVTTAGSITSENVSSSTSTGIRPVITVLK